MKKKLLLFILLLMFFIPVNAKEDKYKIVSGDLETVGSEICFDTECFYVLGNDGNKISMLAKYNLYVGGEGYWIEWTPYGDEATNLQDKTATGKDYPRTKSTVFSKGNISYWDSLEFGSYVYDERSLLYKYVEKYKSILNNMGVVVLEARLLNFEEFLSFNCDSKCNNAPSWLKSTAYWTGFAIDDVDVFIIEPNWVGDAYDLVFTTGVRPVIEVPVEYFSEKGIFNGSVLKVSNSDGVISNDDNW